MRIVKIKSCFSFIAALIISQNLSAQYTVNGSASQVACNEYRLTQAINTQSGSVWNNIKINLTQSFNFNFDVVLSDPLQLPHDGADGIAFVLQPISTSVGTSGSGMGYAGISPAVGVTIDTYLNGADGDPASDHIAIQLNGDINHNTANNIAGPVSVLNSSTNIEDALWHSLRIVWDAPTTTLSVYMDGSLRLTTVKDFVTDVFAGNPLVFWGFTGSTGGENNYQAFKTALNPAFTFNATQKRCINEPVTFNNTSISFSTIAKFYWNFGDGSPIDSVNFNPAHTYTAGGDYSVIQRIIGADGCDAVDTQVVRIGTKPIANFGYNNNCVPTSVPSVFFFDSSLISVGTLNSSYWDFGNGQTTSGLNPTTSYPTPGDKIIKHTVTTIEGCESDTLYKIVHMYTNPVVDFTFTDSVCLGKPTLFFGSISNAVGDSGALAWNWSIDNISTGIFMNVQNPTYTYLTPGNHTVLLTAIHPNYHQSPGNTNSNACFGLAFKNIFVVNKPTAYFKQNTICQAATTTFTDSSYTSDGIPINQWWWALGNSGLSIQQNPPANYTIAGADTIRLVVHNAKGCASDTLKQPIVIHSKPIANFGYSNTLCSTLPMQFSDSSKVTGGYVVNKWSWLYNTAEWSTAQNPSKTFTAGTQTVQLVATSNMGCVSDLVAKTFYINPTPDVTINFNDACKNALVDFSAVDNSGTVTQWKWAFGDGGIANTQNAQHAYTANGTYKVKLFASASNGCYSDSLTGDIVIYSTNVFAGNDTIAAAGQPVQLNATGGLSYIWSPAFDLNDANIANPIAILAATQTFTVRAFTPEGCESFDDITVKIYKGPDIYLPNAFTPNADGLNDVFKGTPVGIKQFNYLKVFNRWGQLLFSTSDYTKGWDGNWRGQKQNSGIFVVMVNAIDFKGNVINKKGTVMLIR